MLPNRSNKIEVDADWNEENAFNIEYKISLKEIFGEYFNISNASEAITLKVDIAGFQAVYQHIPSPDLISSQRNVSGQNMPGQNPNDPNSVMGNSNTQPISNEMKAQARKRFHLKFFSLGRAEN